MTDYAALEAELEKPEYAGLDDKARVDRLNAAVLTTTRAVPAQVIKKLWAQRMVLAAAWVAAQDANLPAELRVLCRATYDNLMGDLFVDMDPRDPTQTAHIEKYLDGLEAAGVLSAELRAETLALATVEQPLRQALGWPGGVNVADLEALRVIARERRT